MTSGEGEEEKLGIGSGTAVVEHLTTASFPVSSSIGYRRHIAPIHWY